MSRFDDYYGGAPDLEPVGPACVEGVVFRVIPEASTRVAALLAGEVDIIQAVPPELISTLEQTPGIQVKTVAGTQPKWMEMNVNQAPFDDVRACQALNYAVDKQLIIDAIYGGKAVACPVLFHPSTTTSTRACSPTPTMPRKPWHCLEAGYTDSNGDSLLDKNG
jgi:peptide/nickel transport system substrate-binding protein